MRFKMGVCNLCGTGCGHFLQTDGRKVYGVAPSERHPTSRGRLCVRGWHIHELLDSNDRIETPLVRKNGELVAASYDDAITLIETKMGKIAGIGAKLAILASARAANEDSYLLMKLARSVFRTGNIAVSSEAGHKTSLEALAGAFASAGAVGTLADIDTAAYIFLVGSDVTKLNPIVGANIHQAALRGARVVTLSSSKTQIAMLSQLHLQQKPGSKRTVLHALAKALITWRKQNGKNLAAEPGGYKEYGDALDQLLPAEIDTASGIPYARLMEEAEHLAQAASIVILFSSGISGLDAETIRAITNLAVLTGKMGEKGSALIPLAGISNLQGAFDMGLAADRSVSFSSTQDKALQQRLSEEWADQYDGTCGLGVDQIFAQLGGQIKALFAVDHDDGIIRHKDGLKALDLLVYVGAFKNPLMEYAHVVLPIAAYSEYDGTYTACDRRVQISSAKTAAPERVLPAWRLYVEIARKGGRLWDYDSSSAVFSEIARVVPEYAGMNHDALKQGFGWYPAVAGISASTSKFLPIKTQPAFKTTSNVYPFSLMIGKAQHYWHQNNLMRKTHIVRREFDATLLLYPEGYIEISASDAQKLQVRDKWRVSVVSAKGAMTVAVKVSDAVQDQTAYIPYFINNMISEFLLPHDSDMVNGEESVIPVRIERI